MFIIYAIIIFLVLVFVHELGHFMTARAVGIRVKEFALGMGPKLLKKQKGETLYSLRAVPIGGFCAMEGEDEESDDPKAFNNKPAPARALVLVAGSLMNILFAILLLIISIFSIGTPGPTVNEITKDSPAAIAGLKPGDRIVEADGREIKEWSDLTAAVGDFAQTSRDPAADTFTLRAEAPDGEVKTIQASLFKDESGEYKIGVTPTMEHPPSYALKSVGYGFKAAWNMTKMMYDVLGQLFTGKAGMDQLTGPIGIVKAVDVTARHGLLYVIELAALISLNLGIVNLLPFPALDGGRILFLVVRLFTGKRVSDSFEGKFHLVGFILLIGLMIYISVVDVGRFIVN
ncbi:MAG: RIP metalloprotease RseP [Clostridiales Family XIII bacterium]|jgi:regulator of sigma E protease|nr:RIP metalloprotease RseP [Clostridiales Family XIII bacterium]